MTIFHSKKNKRIIFMLGLTAVLIPAVAWCFGSLKEIKYKIKKSDGNRWEHLYGGGSIVRGSEVQGKIAFTFDDGPDHRTTPLLLNELDKYGIKATFFVNGHRFHSRTAGGEENKVVLREIFARGHIIANHTFSHEDVSVLKEDSWRGEVFFVNNMVEDITSKNLTLFRPPFGRISGEALQKLSTKGYTVVMWNLDPLDWKSRTPTELLNRTKKIIEENPHGGIFLLHDTNRNTVVVFSMIMEWLLEYNEMQRVKGGQRLEFVGIDEFIKN
jgi:peptidoglycan-N-acetylglucosamine deacetylase